MSNEKSGTGEALLHGGADFTLGEPVGEPEPCNLLDQVVRGDDFAEWQARTAAGIFLEAYGKADAGEWCSTGMHVRGHDCPATPTLPPHEPEDSQTCQCELRSEPGPHPICDVFEASIMHDSLCITCHHSEACHECKEGDK